MFGWRLVRVRGDSMTPHIPAGAFALFRPVKRLNVGDVVLADHARYGRIIKAVKTIEKDGVRLEGRAPQSTSSTAMGLVPLERILGRLTLQITKPEKRAVHSRHA